MFKCFKCNHKFKYSKLLKAFWNNFTDIKCKECETSYKHSIFNRFLFISYIATAGITTIYYRLHIYPTFRRSLIKKIFRRSKEVKRRNHNR